MAYNESARVIIGIARIKVTNGAYTLPNSVLNGYTGDYYIISSINGAIPMVRKNGLACETASRTSASNPVATFAINGDSNVVYIIIKVG